jgi:hypothetical protein
MAQSLLTAPTGIQPVVASAAGIALAGLAFYPRSVRQCPPGLTTAFMEYRPAGAMMRLSP